MVVLGWCLDLMFLEVFSNLNDSMILWLGKECRRLHEKATVLKPMKEMPQTLKAAKTKAVQTTVIWLCCTSTASYGPAVLCKGQLGCRMQWVTTVHSLGLLLDWTRAVGQGEQFFSSHCLHQLDHGLRMGHGALDRERPLLWCSCIPAWDLTLAFFSATKPLCDGGKPQEPSFSEMAICMLRYPAWNLGTGLAGVLGMHSHIWNQ